MNIPPIPPLLRAAALAALCCALPVLHAEPSPIVLEPAPVAAAQPGDKVAPSPDLACELVSRGFGPQASPQGEEAFIRMGSGSGAAGGQLAFTFAALGSHAPVDGFWSPDSSYLAVVVRHTKYHDLMLVGRALLPVSRTQVGVTFASVRVPLLPAGGILEKFPTAGKPPGRQFRLDTMSITRAEWSPDGRTLALQAALGLADTPASTVAANDPAYRYVVDFTLTMPAHPPALLPAGKGFDGGDAEMKLLNVAFLPVP